MGHSDTKKLFTVVRMEVDLALGRLGRRYGVTKRAMVERLILEADDAELRGLESPIRIPRLGMRTSGRDSGPRLLGG